METDVYLKAVSYYGFTVIEAYRNIGSSFSTARHHATHNTAAQFNSTVTQASQSHSCSMQINAMDMCVNRTSWAPPDVLLFAHS